MSFALPDYDEVVISHGLLIWRELIERGEWVQGDPDDVNVQKCLDTLALGAEHDLHASHADVIGFVAGLFEEITPDFSWEENLDVAVEAIASLVEPC